MSIRMKSRWLKTSSTILKIAFHTLSKLRSIFSKKSIPINGIIWKAFINLSIQIGRRSAAVTQCAVATYSPSVQKLMSALRNASRVAKVRFNLSKNSSRPKTPHQLMKQKIQKILSLLSHQWKENLKGSKKKHLKRRLKSSRPCPSHLFQKNLETLQTRVKILRWVMK